MSSTLRKSGGEGWLLRRSQQQNWSNAQDLPPGSCRARGSELLQKVDSFGTLPHLPCLEETGTGRGRDGPQNGAGACFLPSASLATSAPSGHTLLHCVILSLARVSRLGPLGIGARDEKLQR